MATPLNLSPQTSQRSSPKTVTEVKEVKLIMVTYYDETGRLQTQLALAGDQNVHLIDNKTFELSTERSPQGRAVDWLKNGIFKMLGEVKTTLKAVKEKK